MIVSGLVFTELSTPLLDKWGAWDDYIGEGVSHLLGLASSPFVETEKIGWWF